MNQQARYQLDLVFSGPLMSQAAGTLAFGVDTAMQRYRETPVFNGSLIKGNIRSAIEEFAELLEDSSLNEKISRWFGAKTDGNAVFSSKADDEAIDSAETHDYKAERARVEFDCFWTFVQDYRKQDEEKKPQRIRIEIDKQRGTVQTGSLQVIEDCFPVGGKNFTFRGKLLLRYRTGDEKRDFIEWLGKALD
ncbi:MAG: hypothetical protein ACRERS_04390, partial [Methylococcales bacterium]